MERPIAPAPIPGDLNADLTVDLTDAILALKVISHMVPAEAIYYKADVNNDGKIGIGEVIYILEKTAGVWR